MNSLRMLFYLAEKICVNELANKVMGRIQDTHLKRNRICTALGLKKDYSNTHENSKLRLYGTLST